MIKLIRTNIFLIFACVLNFSLCITYLLFFIDPFWGPNHEYTEIARNIASGNGFVGPGFFRLKYAPTAFLPPAYSYLLAIFIKMFSLSYAFYAIRIFQLFINTAICIMIYFVAREVFNKKAAILSAIIFAIYFPFIQWAMVIWDTQILALLLLMIAFLSYKFQNRFIDAAFLGLCVGIGVLVNPILLVLLPFLLIYLWFKFRECSPKIVIRLITLLLMSILVVLPWAVRNSLIFKAFVPVRTGLWLNLYLGNNQDATGTVFLKYRGIVFKDFNQGITYHFRPMINELLNKNEYEQDHFFKAKYLNYLRSNPISAAKLFFKKLFYFVWFNPYEKNNIFAVMQYACILILSVYGSLKACVQGRRIGIFLLIFISFTCIYSLTGPFFNWKYRLPVEPYLIILSGFGLYEILKTSKVIERFDA